MKLLKRIAVLLLLLCLISPLMPAAEAAEAPAEDFYEGKSWQDLVDYLFEKYHTDPEDIALGYRNIVTGEEQYHNADQYMVSGSMYKVPLNMLFTEKIYNGEMDFDTLVGGVQYSQLLNDTIVHSSNDYAAILWKEAGGYSYQNYRRAIAPYMGEDPDDVDWKYYENNFFTPRQMIHCLNLLATEPDRFPELIATMQKAEPDNYFQIYNPGYELAHKYGYLVDGNRLYMCDCAVAYTDEPIVFVMFTDNILKPYEVMGEFAQLMCGYAQYTTARRLEAEAAEAEKARAEAEKAAAGDSKDNLQEDVPQMEQAITAVPEEGAAGGIGFGSVISCVVVIAALIAAVAAVTVSRKRHRVSTPWAIAGVVIAGLAMLLAIIGSGLGTIVAKPTGDPRQDALEFMDAVTSGDYSGAYSKLKSYSSLGLENSPADEAGQLMLSALRDSYSYQLSGSCLIDKLQARQQIQFTYLNLPAMAEDLKEQTLTELEKIVKRRPKSKVYDENNNYFPEVTQEAYINAVKAVLKNAGDYYETAGLQLQLEYSDGRWWIVPTEGLLKVLSGGISR